MKALFKISAELRASKQQPQVQRINCVALEKVWHLIVYNALGQTLSDCSFTNTGITYV